MIQSFNSPYDHSISSHLAHDEPGFLDWRQDLQRRVGALFPAEVRAVDTVEELEAGVSVTATYRVTGDEEFLGGHFPGNPVFPGVLILEAMAQAAAILVFRTLNVLPDEKAVYYYAGIDNARFKRPVTPGDRMELFVEMTASKRGIYKYKAVAKVDGQIVAEADLMCAHRKMGDA